MGALVGKEAVTEVLARFEREGRLAYPIERLALLDLIRGVKVQWRWGEFYDLGEFFEKCSAHSRVWSAGQILEMFDHWVKNPPTAAIFKSQY